MDFKRLKKIKSSLIYLLLDLLPDEMMPSEINTDHQSPIILKLYDRFYQTKLNF